QGTGKGPTDNFTIVIGKGCPANGGTTVTGGTAGNLTVAIGGGNATGWAAGGSNVNDMTVAIGGGDATGTATAGPSGNASEMAFAIGGGTAYGTAYGGDNLGFGPDASSGTAGNADALTVSIGGNALGRAVGGSRHPPSDARRGPRSPGGPILTPA